ncbi:MAG TPA: bifunctional demethylmenaquinone methyltransferase/2-methoxy-6-polyprenyl-1,4-benzoquinol methylase UbiE [Acidobacteriota bacterium]
MRVVDKRSVRIREMFASIAPRYDLLNHLLSLNVDRRWRRHLARKLQQYSRPGRVLDVCTGTGDLAIELSHRNDVFGADFCHPMLVIAQEKLEKLDCRVKLLEADALCLPFPGSWFDVVSVGFGVRNLEDLQRGLLEFFRVLRPGGILVILEFSKPATPIFRDLYRLYFDHVLPNIGRLVSKSDGPYRYLPDSVKEFPDQQDLCRILERCGFDNVEFENLSAGIAALHFARRPAS